MTNVNNQCFACGGELEPAWPGATEQFNDAVMFNSHGNYGSTVFDPMDSHLSLLINIHDSCLIERKDRVCLVRTFKPIPTYETEQWVPEEHP